MSNSAHKAFTPPLSHDRDEFADWGWIRDATGAIVYEAKLPCRPNSREAKEHHRNNTDPAQCRVDALLAAFDVTRRLSDWTKRHPVLVRGQSSYEQLAEIEAIAQSIVAKISP